MNFRQKKAKMLMLRRFQLLNVTTRCSFLCFKSLRLKCCSDKRWKLKKSLWHFLCRSDKKTRAKEGPSHQTMRRDTLGSVRWQWLTDHIMHTPCANYCSQCDIINWHRCDCLCSCVGPTQTVRSGSGQAPPRLSGAGGGEYNTDLHD